MVWISCKYSTLTSGKALRKADKLSVRICPIWNSLHKLNNNFAFNASNIYHFLYFVKPENLYSLIFCFYQQTHAEAIGIVSLGVWSMPVHLCTRSSIEKSKARQVCKICSSYCIVFQQLQLFCFAKVQASVWSQIRGLLMAVKGHKNNRFKFLPGSRHQN